MSPTRWTRTGARKPRPRPIQCCNDRALSILGINQTFRFKIADRFPYDRSRNSKLFAERALYQPITACKAAVDDRTAKPVNGQKVVQDWEPGDPARDPAVRAAIQEARQSLSASR